MKLPDGWRTVPVAALGLAAPLGAFIDGYYDLKAWGPVAIALLVIGVALAVAGQRLSRPAAASVCGLTGLWAWSLLSQAWSGAPEDGLLDANRWLLYAAVLLVLGLLTQTKRDVTVLLGAVSIGLLVIVGWVAIALIAGDARFLGRRLAEPFEYTNAVGTYLVLAAWPLLAVAERLRSALLAGAGASGATLALCLAVLTQSRGVAAATIGSALIVLAIFPGRVRRAWLLLVVAGGVAAAGGTLLDVYSSSAGAVPASEAIDRALRASIAAALAVGAAWAAARSLARQWSARTADRTVSARRIAAIGLAAVAGAALVAAVARAPQISDRISSQWNSFTSLGADTAGSGATRLASGAGNRYDYWRIAWRTFESEPLRGVGAGGYPVRYFRERGTTEDIRQPHSIELQTLSELGLVGGLLLLVFLGGVAWGAWRWRSRRAAPAETIVPLAASGIFAAWLVHSSVDWMHLIPSLAGTALCAAAVLTASPRPEGEPSRPVRGRGWLAATAACTVVAVIGTPLIARQWLADRHLRAGQAELAGSPPTALREARDAIGLDGDSVEARYLAAAVLARQGSYAGARNALIGALAVEPDNFLTWTLLGDLAARRGDRAAARVAYRRALELNPRDPLLRKSLADVS